MERRWTVPGLGPLDGNAKTGAYTGTKSSDGDGFSGTYTVNGAKQFISVPNCIEYFVAPNGTWQLFAPNSTTTFDGSTRPGCVISNGVVSWSPPADHFVSVLGIVDEAAAANAGDAGAIIYQELVLPPGTTSKTLPDSLIPGKNYIAAVISANSEMEVIYACNKEFVRKWING